MFKFFRKKDPRKDLSQLSISSAIEACLKRGANNLHINLYIEDQILFQIMPAKNFAEKGFEYKYQDLVMVHFFNKNKDLTLATWEKFIREKMEDKLFYFEEPKGVHIYLENLGNDLKEIEAKIHKTKAFYELDPSSHITIEYVDY